MISFKLKLIPDLPSLSDNLLDQDEYNMAYLSLLDKDFEALLSVDLETLVVTVDTINQCLVVNNSLTGIQLDSSSLELSRL